VFCGTDHKGVFSLLRTVLCSNAPKII
jgi:hypothetical protein